MFRIKNPDDFDVVFTIAKGGIPKDLTFWCPCQGKVGMKKDQLSEHNKSGKTHQGWMNKLCISIMCLDSVIKTVEENGYWKYKAIFNTEKKTVMIFAPRDTSLVFSAKVVITPKEGVPVERGEITPLVPAFLNTLAEKLDEIMNQLEQEDNVRILTLVYEARQYLNDWSADTASVTSGSDKPESLILPDLTTTTNEGEEDESVSSATQSLPRRPAKEVDPVLAEVMPPAKEKAQVEEESIADRVKKAVLAKREAMAKLGIFIDADLAGEDE